MLLVGVRTELIILAIALFEMSAVLTWIQVCFSFLR